MDISATKLRNYFINDPILDWFNYHGESKGFQKDSGENYTNLILDRGNEFEKNVIDKIKSKNFSFVDVKEKHSKFCKEAVCDTRSYMREGVEIIYQGFLYDFKLKIYGIPDLLIRSDIISKLFQNNPKIIKPTNKEFCWTYFVVDIKYSTINIGSKNQILNEGSKKAFKAQIYVYNWILNNMFFGELDEMPQPFGFILSRRMKNKNDIIDGMNCLGEINYENELYGDDVRRGLEWVRDVIKNGGNWDVYNPHCVELKPNMKNHEDYPWSSAKKKLANEQNDLTRIWHVSKRIRDEVDEYGGEVTEYFSDDDRRKIIKKMIGGKKKNNFSRVDLSCFNEKLCFYVDFEFINGCEFSFDHDTRTHLYMIGVGHEENGKWVFNTFIPEKLEDRDEKDIIVKWMSYMKEVGRRIGKEYVVIHWTNAEPSLFNRLKYRLKLRGELHFIDLQKIFKNSHLVFDGMNNYGLKTVAKSMKNAGLIKTEWDDNVTDGLGANMILIRGLNRGNLREIDGMGEIIKYNEVDCLVLYEILKYLGNSLQ